MTEPDPAPEPSDGRERVRREHGGRRPARDGLRRSLPGCLAVLVALAVVVGGFYLALTKGVEELNELLAAPPDYAGPGTGRVTVRVREGETLTEIGRHLEAKNVVKSVEAFIAAARVSPEARSIQVGVYELQHKMSAEAALDALLDPSNLVATTVTIPEGLTVSQTLDVLAKHTDYTREQFARAVKTDLGLPEYAGGEPEGYLFPATYDFDPAATPREMLRRMVQEFEKVAAKLPISAASSVGYTRHELVIVASIIAQEVSQQEDMAAVAEVIANRLDGSCQEEGVPPGMLQMDSTVHYLTEGDTDTVFTDEEARSSDSPYNTYKHPGLPPGPIASPGRAAMEAVLNPTDQGYCYFVTVNLNTGKTVFSQTLQEHRANVDQLTQWCRRHEGRC